MSIRFKVILPYLFLTLVVAVTGAYVVTRLVTDSLTERLNNQLLEAGRVVSDSFVRQEIQHIENARIIVHTRGVAEALREADPSALAELAKPMTKGVGIENLILVNMRGEEMLHLQAQTDGSILNLTRTQQNQPLLPLKALLDDPNPNSPPTRAILKDQENNRWYYFTALPFALNNEMMGVVAVGTSMDVFLPALKNTALADVIIYGQNGQAIASTFQAQGEEKEIFLKTLSMPVLTYQELAAAGDLVSGENISLEERTYSLARGRLQVSDDILAVFAVVLPADYVVKTSAVNRNLYVLIFSLAMILVILLGFVIARRIIDPLYSLAQTSKAISSGDLTRRTGIRSNDEIGTLATSFDEMTENLQERTLELERTNKILEQMDRTKSSFIHISAHELRTPLTLIQGYSHILEQMSGKDSELETISRGLTDGYTRMEEVVNSMLDVSRIDSKTLQVSAKPIKLGLVIAKASLTFQAALEERQIEYDDDGLEALPMVPADADMLYKVFYHVLMNAVKYTPDGGKIQVSGRVLDETENGMQVEVIVRDTGIGIDKQNHELVFEKFYQIGEVLLHSSGKTKFKGGGPGLGLAIARGIVEAHGGRIWLDSPGASEETNPGTTVFIRLPADGPR